MLLYHDRPASKGVENALRRVSRLARFAYTPILPLPIVEKLRTAEGETANLETCSPAWLPLKGLPYSSVRRTETYLGFNVTPETFLTALSNPNSVAYKRPITGTGQNVHNYYGIVCSCFVSYSLGLPYRTNCARWPGIPGIHEVDTSQLENIRLADVVLNWKKHIAVVTDIERDVDGKVHFISVSESTMPFIRTTRFDPEQFRKYWLENDYVVYHCDWVDDVPYEPDPFAPAEGDPEMPAPFINRSLMPDFGNKANYKLGVDPVELSVFEEDCKIVEVSAPDGEKIFLPVRDGKAVLEPEKTGYYSAACVKGDELSAPVEWCVTDLIITPEKTELRFKEQLTLRIANPAKDRIVAWQYNRRADDKGAGGGWLDLSDEDSVTIPGPNVAVPVELYLIARGRFGDYTSRRVPLEITE